MAFDMSIKLGKIKGESTIDGHKDEIDVLAWSWGMSQSGSFGTGGGGGAGKVNVQDLSLTKWVDSASPALMLSCAKGTHIDEAVLTMRKSGDKPLDYVKITMKDILISNVSTGGSGGEDRLTENVGLNFGQVKVEYQSQDKTGAAKGPPIIFDWNIGENKPNS